MARHGKSIALQSEGPVGEKYLPVGVRVKNPRAVEGQSAPTFKGETGKRGRSRCVVRCVQSDREGLRCMVEGKCIRRRPAGSTRGNC
jgi:hypothetical protein